MPWSCSFPSLGWGNRYSNQRRTEARSGNRGRTSLRLPVPHVERRRVRAFRAVTREYATRILLGFSSVVALGPLPPQSDVLPDEFTLDIVQEWTRPVTHILPEIVWFVNEVKAEVAQVEISRVLG